MDITNPAFETLVASAWIWKNRPRLLWRGFHGFLGFPMDFEGVDVFVFLVKKHHPHWCFKMIKMFLFVFITCWSRSPSFFSFKIPIFAIVLATNKNHNPQLFLTKLPLAWRQSALLARWSLVSEVFPFFGLETHGCWMKIFEAAWY